MDKIYKILGLLNFILGIFLFYILYISRNNVGAELDKMLFYGIFFFIMGVLFIKN